MLTLAVAAPLAFLPIVSLAATLRWMAASSSRVRSRPSPTCCSFRCLPSIAPGTGITAV